MELSWSELPNLTLLIRRSQTGDSEARSRLFDLAYPTLKRIAAGLLHGDSRSRMLEPNELLHEVYAKRLDKWRGNVNNRQHYLAAVTTAMKNELIDRARQAQTLRRTAPDAHGRFPVKPALALPLEEILSLEREIKKLEAIDPRAAQVIRLRYYGGCSWEETATALESTVKIVRTDWEFAAKWLAQRLADPPPHC